MLTMRALTLLFVLLFAGSAWAQSQEIKKPVPPITKETKGSDKAKDNANSQQTITIEIPPSINITMGGKLEVKTDNEDTKRNDESPNWAEGLIAFFTGLLVFVTGYLVYYTKNLWGATDKLVIGAEDTARKQLRAYVNVECVEFVHVSVSPNTKGPTLWVHVRFKNFGQIPATKIEYWFICDTAELPLPTTFVGKNVPPQQIGVIAPHDTFTAKMELGAMDDPNRNSAFFVRGEVHYFDGFEPDRVTQLLYERRGGDDWSWHGQLDISQQGNRVT